MVVPAFEAVDNWPVMFSPWQRRIQRAQELASQHPFAGEILRFYNHVAQFQEDLYNGLTRAITHPSGSHLEELNSADLSALCSNFQSFLSLVEAHGPKSLAQLSRDLCARGDAFWSYLLQETWATHSPSTAEEFVAQAFLQPCAELMRSRAQQQRPSQSTYAVCPFCTRKPGLGVLRPMGEGAARSLVCSLCLNEWEFRRLVCPGCGEGDDKQLAVFAASEFDYIRVETCDTCKTYIKTIDLTKNGRAEPLVDELASASLDLWAHDRGYTKLQKNLLGM
jgi:FdhE protein